MGNKPYPNIIERRNKAIAIFMGGKIDSEFDTWDFPATHELFDEMRGYGDDHLIFHKDWNWLMLVVDKIENLPPLNDLIEVDIISKPEFLDFGDFPVHLRLGKNRVLIHNVPLAASSNQIRWADYPVQQRSAVKNSFPTKILATFKVIGDFCIWLNKQKKKSNGKTT